MEKPRAIQGIYVLLLAGSILVVYWGSRTNSFHYDDIHSIVENPHVRSLVNIPAFFYRPDFFSEDPKGAMYRPLVLTSYALNYALGGYEVRGYHWFNLLIHIANSLLVVTLVRTLNGNFSQACLAGWIFGLHPVNSEVVNYISSRSEAICAFFFLTSFWTFIKSGSRCERSWGWYSISLLAFVCALLSKSVGITLLGIILLFELNRSRKGKGFRALLPAFFSHWPFFAIGFAYLLGVQGFLRTAVVDEPVRGFTVQLSTQLKALAYYLKLLWFPHGLNVEHQFVLANGFFDLVTLSVFALMLSVGFFLACKRGYRESTFFWMGWSFLVLLPVLVIPLNVLVNEHRLYIPSVALAVVLGGMSSRLIARYGSKGLFVCLLGIGIFGGMSVQRTQAWASEETLWSDALAKAPMMPRPHLYVGNILKESGQYESALHQYDAAFRVYPEALSGGDLLAIFNNQGATYLAMGRNTEAIACYRRALSLDSTYTKARESLNGLLAFQERDPEAKRLYQQGMHLMISGRVDGAIRHLRRSLEIQVVPEIYMALGMAYERKDDLENALKIYEELKVLFPESDFGETAAEKIRAYRGKTF